MGKSYITAQAIILRLQLFSRDITMISKWPTSLFKNSAHIKVAEKSNYYLRRRLANGEAGKVLWRSRQAVCVSAEPLIITYRLHAALVSAAKVMRCIQCSVVSVVILLNYPTRPLLHPELLNSWVTAVNLISNSNSSSSSSSNNNNNSLSANERSGFIGN